jgi:hypothetical protein
VALNGDQWFFEQAIKAVSEKFGAQAWPGESINAVILLPEESCRR